MQSDWKTYLNSYNNASDEVKQIIDSELIPSFSQELIQKNNLPLQKQRNLTMFVSEVFLKLKTTADAPDILGEMFDIDVGQISSLTIEIKKFVESKPTAAASEIGKNEDVVSIPISKPPVVSAPATEEPQQNKVPDPIPAPAETTEQVSKDISPDLAPPHTVQNPSTSIDSPSSVPVVAVETPAQNELNAALNQVPAPTETVAQNSLDAVLNSMPPLPTNTPPPITNESTSVLVPPPTPEPVALEQSTETVEVVEPPHTIDGGLEKIHGYGAYRDIHPHEDAHGTSDSNQEPVIQAISQEETFGDRPELAKVPTYSDNENNQGINQ